MHPTPYVASLRIYEPIHLFEVSNQVRWSNQLIASPTGRDEQLRSLLRSVISESLNFRPDGAHILEHEGKRYVAPWSTAARCWTALEDFKLTLPTSITKFFIPQVMEDSINGAIDIVEDKVSHILTSTWSIPPRWFALFSPDERLRGVNEDGHYTILRTSISNAKSRCSFTHQAVLGAFGEGAVEGEVAELLSWLEIFDGKSIVELDYGGLAEYLNYQLLKSGEVGLDADTSVEDVSTSIAGLASGDGALAGSGYERLISRWRRVSALESAT
ncbi:MAG: hypothetical protein RLZZ183_968 [Actinomycetota bacterium]|jgi:hypothetical protein